MQDCDLAPEKTTRAQTACRHHQKLTREELTRAMLGMAGGDTGNFEIVYAATSAKIYSIVVRIVGRRDVADDILQNVCVRVWQHACEFDPARGSPITWIATIARNLALDELKRKTTTSLEDCLEYLDVASEDDPLRNLQHAEGRTKLLHCIDRLDPEKREVLLLAYYHNMTRDEISARVGRPAATIKTWLRRSLAQLRKLHEEATRLGSPAAIASLARERGQSAAYHQSITAS